ncbi:MAG: hypothetical protein IJJ66_02305 [Treponema sp.]|nr:hypothetical protein [Treponema sp.]
MQKHFASAIIQKIQGWIFLWQDFLFLAKEYRAKDGGLAHAEAFCFCNPKKIQGGIFLGDRPTRDWRGGEAVRASEWSSSGTPESPWRKVVFGRISQEIIW